MQILHCLWGEKHTSVPQGKEFSWHLLLLVWIYTFLAAKWKAQPVRTNRSPPGIPFLWSGSFSPLGTTAGHQFSPGGLNHEHNVTHTLITANKQSVQTSLIPNSCLNPHLDGTSNSEWPPNSQLLSHLTAPKSAFWSYHHPWLLTVDLSDFWVCPLSPGQSPHQPVPCPPSLGTGLTAVVGVRLYVALLFCSSQPL